MLIDKESTSISTASSTSTYQSIPTSSSNQEEEEEEKKEERRCCVVDCNHGCLLLCSFFVTVILAIVMDAGMNQNLTNISKDQVQMQYWEELSSLYRDLGEKHRNETTNATEMGQLLLEEAKDLYETAKSEYEYATEVNELKESLYSLMETKENVYEKSLERAQEYLESSREHIRLGQRLKRSIDLHFCVYTWPATVTCEMIGETSKVGNYVKQLQDWGMGNITQGEAEKERYNDEWNHAQQLHKKQQENTELANTYQNMENTFQTLAQQHQGKADQEWEDANHYLEEAQREQDQVDQFHALATNAMNQRDTALDHQRKSASKVTWYAWLAVTMGLVLVPFFFVACCIHSHVVTLAWKHTKNYYHHLSSSSMHQNFITNAICHGFIFCLLLGWKHDALLQFYEQNALERGEIIVSFAIVATVIETVLFSLLSFSHIAMSLDDPITITGSVLSSSPSSSSSSSSWRSNLRKFILQGMVLVSIFVIQVLILICIYVTQIMILLIACGSHNTILFTIIQFMSHWTFMTMMILILMAMSRLWSPLDFSNHCDGRSRIGVGTYPGTAVHESTILLCTDEHNSTNGSSITCSVEESITSIPQSSLVDDDEKKYNHDNDSATWLWSTGDSWSDDMTDFMLSPDGGTLLSTVAWNEFSWLKGELYVLCLCFQMLLLSCVVAVLFNCFPHVGLWYRWILLLSVVPMTLWQLSAVFHNRQS